MVHYQLPPAYLVPRQNSIERLPASIYDGTNYSEEDMEKREEQTGDVREGWKKTGSPRVRIRNFFCCKCCGLARSSNIGTTCLDCGHKRKDCDSCSQGQSSYDPASENPYHQ